MEQDLIRYPNQYRIWTFYIHKQAIVTTFKVDMLYSKDLQKDALSLLDKNMSIIDRISVVSGNVVKSYPQKQHVSH